LKSRIQTRLLILTALLLGTFLALAGSVLERSFRASVLTGAEEQLRLVTYSLMGVLQSGEADFVVPEPLPEPRLSQPVSGLYAWITGADDRVLWQSPSSLSLPPAQFASPPDLHRFHARGSNADGVSRPERTRGIEGDSVALAAGQFDFHTDRGSADGRAGEPLLHLRYAVIWEDLEDTLLTFHVAAERAPFEAAIQDFRRSLYVGLGAVTLLFVLAQFLAVRWSLRPLRRMALQIRELEEGRRHRLGDDYPLELEGLVENLDRFVAHEEARRRRYGKAMEDLAHSLKTPLAVLRNATEQVTDATRELLTEQLDRMQNTVTRQLSRAAVTGPVVVGRSEPLGMLVQRLLRALQTAYRDRAIDVTVEIPDHIGVRGDERDLMEMLGNVLDNAFKYTRSAIRVRAHRDDRLTIAVDDDGPGLPPALRAEVLNRGTRADEVQPGQGIGLAVVAELVEFYQGRLILDDSDLGGLSVRIELP
jgi:two-component system, OmpR family, sensor histidine kinase PhoQ